MTANRKSFICHSKYDNCYCTEITRLTDDRTILLIKTCLQPIHRYVYDRIDSPEEKVCMLYNNQMIDVLGLWDNNTRPSWRNIMTCNCNPFDAISSIYSFKNELEFAKVEKWIFQNV